MTQINEIVQTTKNAFEFIDQLYLESSFLVKEVEGQLSEEKEEFIIAKASGYSISTRSSSGLESINVARWLTKQYSVAFIPRDSITEEKGQTKTEINNKLRVFFLRILFVDRLIEQPIVLSGVLYDFRLKKKDTWIKKFENLLGLIEYNDQKIFSDYDNLKYEDSKISFKGKLVKTNLFDIKNADDIKAQIIDRSLAIYRQKK